MVLYSSKKSLISFCFSFMVISFLPHGAALNFNLTNISPKNLNDDITVEKDAYISGQGIQVTSEEHSMNLSERSAGRAMYVKPLHLWDKSSGILTDFDTHFAFKIDSELKAVYGEGMTFFLIPSSDSNITAGAAMGLPIDPTTFHPTSAFVTVEFDALNNIGVDPDNIKCHVGININSLKSNLTAVWDCDIYNGYENEAWISYNSSSKNLSVVFSGFDIFINHTRVVHDLHLRVDLREYLPEWVRIGFSASTGTFFERHTVRSWQFNSNLQINETRRDGDPTKKGKGEHEQMRTVVKYTIGLFFVIAGSTLLGLVLWNKKSIEQEEDGISFQLLMEEEFEKGKGPKKFSHTELSYATNNFDEAHKLGAGGFGIVYKGFLSEFNCYVAVKKISKGSKQGIKEYAAEVKIISKLRHKNLVRLIGWCHENRELLLVYEFLPNASLDTHLFNNKTLLTWDKRYNIAKCVASALLYLHEEWEQCVVHRDVKPSNIMLDQNFNTKLVDFGLARLVDHEKGTKTTVLGGTMGYMAPESVVTGKASKESDVYSFGIVVLEIACGRKPIDTSVAQESDVMLVEFVWNLYGNRNILDAIDKNLGTDFEQQEAERLMIVGLWCAHPDLNIRPSIRQALSVLDLEAPLPALPEKMPMATY